MLGFRCAQLELFPRHRTAEIAEFACGFQCSDQSVFIGVINFPQEQGWNGAFYKPNRPAARPKLLSKFGRFLLAAAYTVTGCFFSKGEPECVVLEFSSLDVLLFFNAAEQFLV